MYIQGNNVQPWKGGHSETCHNMHEARKHYANLSKPVTKDKSMWFHLYEMSKVVKCVKTESGMVVVKSLKREK
jgi:hypothetical protein